jgi:hypothetical protein
MEHFLTFRGFFGGRSKDYLQHSLESLEPKDQMIWRCTTNGMFLVRSAYYMAEEMYNNARGESSIKQVVSSLWKTIWNLKYPTQPKYSCGELAITCSQQKRTYSTRK